MKDLCRLKANTVSFYIKDLSCEFWWWWWWGGWSWNSAPMDPREDIALSWQWSCKISRRTLALCTRMASPSGQVSMQQHVAELVRSETPSDCLIYIPSIGKWEGSNHLEEKKEDTSIRRQPRWRYGIWNRDDHVTGALSGWVHLEQRAGLKPGKERGPGPSARLCAEGRADFHCL